MPSTTIALADDNANFNQDDQSGILVFQLPDLMGNPITSADLTTFIDQPSSAIEGAIDVYGVRSSSSPTVVVGDYDFGPTSTDPLIQDNYAVDANATTAQFYSTNAAADVTLGAFLTTLYTNGAVAGDYAFIRLQPDSESANRWNVASGNNTDATLRPVLTINTLIPEPASLSLLGLAGLAMRRRA